MWLILTTGYYSAVAHRNKPDYVMVRCRAQLHAERLIEFFQKDKNPKNEIPELVESPPPADYRWRVTLTKHQWASFVAFSSLEISYDNFKNDAHKRENPTGYVTALHKIWDVMLGLQDTLHPDGKTYWTTSYGYTGYTGKKEGPFLDDDDPFPYMIRDRDTEKIVVGGEKDETVTANPDDIDEGSSVWVPTQTEDGTTVRLPGEVIRVEKGVATVTVSDPVLDENGDIVEFLTWDLEVPVGVLEPMLDDVFPEDALGLKSSSH